MDTCKYIYMLDGTTIEKPKQMLLSFTVVFILSFLCIYFSSGSILFLVNLWLEMQKWYAVSPSL